MFFPTHTGIKVLAIFCFPLLLALVLFVLIMICNFQKRQHAVLMQLEEMKVVHLRSLLQAQMETEEQTYQKIAREMHDNIAQKISLANLHLNTLNERMPGNVLLQNCHAIMVAALRDLRDLGRSIGPELLLLNGLAYAIRYELELLQNTGKYSGNMHITGDAVFLSPQTELVLYRISQEALHNVVKHAVADIVDVTLHYSVSGLQLTIADNGIGIPLEMTRKSTGMGVHNMHRRARIIGGVCYFKQQQTTGTTLIIKIPVNEKESNNKRHLGG